MSSSRAMANKFTTSSSRSRVRRARVQNESGILGGVKPPLLQKESRSRMGRLFCILNLWYEECMKNVFLFAGLFLLSFSARAEDFHGYPCTQDCSGHEAGYEWAQDHGVDDPDDCGGNSNSFIEGCRSWAEEQEDEEEQSDSPDDDTL